MKKVYSAGYIITDKMIDDGISLKELAHRLSITPDMLLSILKNELPINQKLANQLNDELGIPAYMFFEFDKEYKYYKENPSSDVQLMNKHRYFAKIEEPKLHTKPKHSHTNQRLACI